MRVRSIACVYRKSGVNSIETSSYFLADVACLNHFETGNRRFVPTLHLIRGFADHITEIGREYAQVPLINSTRLLLTVALFSFPDSGLAMAFNQHLPLNNGN